MSDLDVSIGRLENCALWGFMRGMGRVKVHGEVGLALAFVGLAHSLSLVLSALSWVIAALDVGTYVFLLHSASARNTPSLSQIS